MKNKLDKNGVSINQVNTAIEKKASELTKKYDEQIKDASDKIERLISELGSLKAESESLKTGENEALESFKGKCSEVLEKCKEISTRCNDEKEKALKSYKELIESAELTLSLSDSAANEKRETLVLREAIISERETKLDNADSLAKINGLLSEAKIEYESLLTSQSNLEKEREVIISNAKKSAETIVNSAKTSSETTINDLQANSTMLLENLKKSLEAEKQNLSDFFKNAQKVFEDSLKQRELELSQKEKDAVALQQRLEETNSNVEYINAYKTQRESLSKEIDSLRKTRDSIFAENQVKKDGLLDSEVASLKEKAKLMSRTEQEILDKEIDEKKKQLEVLEADIKTLTETTSALAVREQDIARREAAATKIEHENQINKDMLDSIRDNLQTLIEERAALKVKGKEDEINALKDYIMELEGKNKRMMANSLAARGKSSAEYVADLENQINVLKETNGQLVKANAGLSSEEARKASAYDDIVAELNNMKDTKKHLEAQLSKVSSLVEQNEQATKDKELFKRELVEAYDLIAKRQSPSRDQRMLPLTRSSQSKKITDFAEKDPMKPSSEIEWLKRIKDGCEKAQIHFSDRMLYAYHTSMKIHEWSPLTVLAGVSGTGKSELPRQYALYGGLYFASIAVKPDWDSPASLFGYYNSIDNKFQPTELLTVLYNAQPGMDDLLGDKVIMVLLDEMNLAYVELYFADLLSKYEYVRGTDEDIEYTIDLGAGAEPETLMISKNVLWTGTMNEDETTKSLSDKVIDRATFISFPRPTTLIDRKANAKNIPSPEYLPFKTWQKWVDSAITENNLKNGVLDRYRNLVQDINDEMSKMGRNIGHRVWQSITNYMFNHPSVIATVGKDTEFEQALNSAFVEAIAFKIMPKLRGIDTIGYQDNLSKLGGIISGINDKLGVDFRASSGTSKELFQWCSSTFLED